MLTRSHPRFFSLCSNVLIHGDASEDEKSTVSHARGLREPELQGLLEDIRDLLSKGSSPAPPPVQPWVRKRAIPMGPSCKKGTP
jgi:hypothetical protein